jgi:hypothetical protein
MPNIIKQETYFLFRYQLVPTSKNIQITIDYQISSYDDLIRLKNEIFKDILTRKKVELKRRKTEAIYKVIYSSQDIYLLRIGSHKKLSRFNKDFREEQIENYPNVLIYINNATDKQIMVIEKNNNAFSSPDVIASILEQSFRDILNKYQLALYIKPILEEREFWNVVREYDQKIHQLTFELIKPNLSNISRTLTDEIKSLQENTNSHNTRLELNAPKDQILENINQDNKDISGLVKYSSDGGGDILLMVKGIRKKIKASKKVHKELTIDEVNIKGRNSEEIISIFNQLFN